MKPLGALTAVAAATLLLSGCSGSSSTAQPATVDFGSQSPTPGMAMTEMPAMTATPMPPDTGSAVPQPVSPTAGNHVDITDFAFAPASITVPVGATITWTNHDAEPHTVVARDGSFRSPALDTNAAYNFTFTAPGSFDYFCSIHPMMTATVVVTK